MQEAMFEQFVHKASNGRKYPEVTQLKGSTSDF